MSSCLGCTIVRESTRECALSCNETVCLALQVKSLQAWQSWANRIRSNRGKVAAMHARLDWKLLECVWEQWTFCARLRWQHHQTAEYVEHRCAPTQLHSEEVLLEWVSGGCVLEVFRGL